MNPPLLSLQGLAVAFGPRDRPVRPVDGVSLELRAGERLALVGESGCGKSLTVLAAARLLPADGRIDAGRVLWKGRDASSFSPKEWRRLLGRGIGFVFQDPGASLNPVLSVGSQVGEALAGRGLRRSEREARVAALLRGVRIPDPARVARAWPHELSGGMQQRAMLAAALAARPELLVADEPTSALDATVQVQLFELLAEAQAETGMALLLITHDLARAPRVADRVAVMYAGRIVEDGPVAGVIGRPAHPYTRALLDADPGRSVPGRRLPVLPGRVPDPSQGPPGCRFRPRCAFALPDCREPEAAAPRALDGGRTAACLRAGRFA